MADRKGKKEPNKKKGKQDPSQNPEDAKIAEILANPGLTISKKRIEILKVKGMRGARKKYDTPDARKDAAKLRRAEKKAESDRLYAELGIAVRPRGEKATPEQKKTKRSDRGKKRRQQSKDIKRAMCEMDPERARAMGIDCSKYLN